VDENDATMTYDIDEVLTSRDMLGLKSLN